MTTTYRVIVTREGDKWLAEAPDVQGAHTWARNLARLDNYIREAIGVVLDLPRSAEDDMDLVYEYHTGDDRLDKAAAELRRERARVREIEQATADTARELATALPVRDVAVLLAISPQRVGQLAPKRRNAA